MASAKAPKKNLDKTALKIRTLSVGARKCASKSKINYEPFDYRDLMPNPIIGVDEVGRGCLAGAVVAAAVVLDLAQPLPVGLNDSTVIGVKLPSVNSITSWLSVKNSVNTRRSSSGSKNSRRLRS